MSSNRSETSEKSLFRPQSVRLMDQVREVLRYHHYAIRTEESYLKWIAAFIRFNDRKHPKDLGKNHIEAFLSNMAVRKNYAAATQSLALNAVVFLYKKVLDLPVADDLAPVRSKKPVRLPVVMSCNEVEQVLSNMSAKTGLLARLMYGGGLRVLEAVRLRVKDFDFENGLIYVHNGKGKKDRATLFASSLHDPIKQHLIKVRSMFDEDIANGEANVWLPDALSRKYPKAGESWIWQYAFPAFRLSIDPRSQQKRRHHMTESSVQKAVSSAVKKTGITKRITSHTFRHSFATHLLESGTNIRIVQKLLGHADVKTTEIYTHVLQQNLQSVVSPLDKLS